MIFKYELYVGTGLDKDNRVISADDHTVARLKAEEKAIGLFGGFSRDNVSGAWEDPAGKVACESSERWTLFSDDPKAVLLFGERLREFYNQASVAGVMPDNSVVFITA